MTQVSYLWDGTVTGDATEAPYDRDEFNTYMFMLNSTVNSENRAFVTPNYLNNLRVYGDNVSMSVTIDSGAALVGGRFAFILDEATSLSLEPVGASGYFRYDFIVLRLKKDEQTIRLAVIKGGETASEYALTEPTLVQTPNLREIPLAKIFVDSSGVIYDKYIYDMREFAHNTYSVNAYTQSYKNLVKNSEFMVYGGAGTSSVPGWDVGQTYVSGLSVSTRLSKMSRGNSIRVTSTAYLVEDGISQLLVLDTSDRTFTVKGSFKYISGTGYVAVELLPATLYRDQVAGIYKRQEYTKLVPDTEVEFQFTITLDDNSAMKAVLLRVFGSNSDTGGVVVDIGQIIVVPGYFPGPFREISETIMLREALTNGAWSATAKSTGTTLIDLNASFGVSEKTKGVYVKLRGRDSGSAGGSAAIQVQGYAAPYDAVYGRVELNGITNDVYRERTFYVPVDDAIINAQDGTPQLRIGVTATGAGTFDATVQVVGVQT